MLKPLFYLCVALLSLGQFSAISKQGETNIYLFDIAVALLFFIGTIYYLLVKKSFKLPKNAYYFGIFTMITVFSLLFVTYKYRVSELIVSGFYLIRWIIYFGASLVVFNMIKDKKITYAAILNVLVVSAVFVTLAGFFQLVVLPDFEVLDPSLGWDPHKNRLASTFYDPNFVGTYFVLALAVLIDRIIGKDFVKKYKVKSWESLSVLVLVLGLFFTFSRSAWLMFAVVVLIYGLFRSKKMLLLALCMGFLAYYAVPRIQTRISGITDPADSAHFRFISWSNSWEIAQDNFLLGTGFNTFRYVQKKYGFLDTNTFLKHSGAGSDSSLLFVLVTTGVFGLFFYLYALVKPSVAAFRKSSSSWLLVTAITLSLLVDSLFINSLFYPQIMFMFLPILVCV